MKQSTRLLVILTLSLSQLIVSAQAPDFAFDDTTKRAEHKDTNKSLADAGLALTLACDGGICGAFTYRFDTGFGINEKDRIIKINDTYTKGRSLKELQEMLAGPPDSIVKITVLSGYGNELTVHSITRKYAEDRKKSPSYTGVIGAVDIFERPRQFGHNLTSAQNCENRGALLSAGAVLRDFLNHRPYGSRMATDAEVLIGIPYSLSFFDKCAMFKESDSAIKFAQEMSKRSLKRAYGPEIDALIKTAQYLEMTGRQSQSLIIWRNLYFGIGDVKVAQKLNILSGYTKFLSRNPNSGYPLQICQELEALCMQNPGKPAFEGLATVGDFYFVLKDFSKSARAYRALADEQKKSFDTRSSNLIRYQDAVITLANLSDVYASSGDFPAAYTCLEEALAIYENNLSSDEIVQLERSASPCHSEIEVRLANAYKKAGNQTRAEKSLAKAKSKIEESFGKDAPQLKALNKPNIDYGKRTQDFNRLNTEWMSAREAYDLLKERKVQKSLALIETLVQQAAKESPIDQYKIFRIFCLARELANSNKKEALEILYRIGHVSELLNDNPMKATVLAEIVFLHDKEGDKAKAEEAWQQLEQELLRLESIAYPGLNDSSRRNKYELVQNNLNRVKRMALAFEFFGDPEAAYTLLTRLLNELTPNNIHRESVIVEILLCQILLKDFTQADKNLEIVCAKKDRGNFLRLIEVAVACINAGRNERARKILTEFENYAGEAKILYDKDNLYLGMASLANRLQDYAIAEKYLNDTNQGKTRGSRDLAYALEMQGRKNEAVQSYLESAAFEKRASFDGRTLAGFSSQEKALELMENTRELSNDTISKLCDSILRNQLDDESIWMSEQIVQFAKKQAAVLTDPAQIEKVRSLFQHEEEWKLAADLKPSANQNAETESGKYSRDLVNVELKKKNYEKASELLILMLEEDAKRPNSQLMPHPGNRRGDLCTQAFEDAGRLDLLEKILKRGSELDQQKNDKVKAANLLNSALLVDNYAKQKKDKKAFALSNTILAVYASNPDILAPAGSRDVSSNIAVLFWAVDVLIRNGQLETAEAITNKIAELYIQNLGKKHPAFIELLEHKAEIRKAHGDKQEQKKLLAQALEIASFNWGAQGRRTAPLRMKYAAALRDLGQEKEATRLEAIEPPVAKRIDEHVLYGSRHVIASHSPPPDAYADTAESALKESLQVSLLSTGMEGNYTGYGSLQIMDMLIEFYLARKNYDEAEKLVLQKLQIWADIEGKCSNQQADCMNEMATICLLKNEKAKAIEWVTKAEKANAFKISRNSLKSAAIWLELGDKARAAKLLAPVASNYEKNFSINDVGELAYLLDHAGKTEDSAKLTKLYEQHMAKYKSHFFGGYGWSHRRIDPDYVLQEGVWMRKTRTMKIIEQNTRQRSFRRENAAKWPETQSLERLKSRVPPNVYQSLLENRERSAERRAKRDVADEESDLAKLKEEKERQDFATARIKAAQEATSEYSSSEIDRAVKKSQEDAQHLNLVRQNIEKLEQAKLEKNAKPREYASAALRLANAYQANKENDKAAEMRLQAINTLLEANDKMLNPRFFNSAFDALSDSIRLGKLPDEAALSYFEKLVDRAEKYTGPDHDDVDDEIYRFISHAYDVRNDRSKSIAFYETWIAVRKKRVGEHDKSLYPLLTNIAAHCQADDDFKKAKQYLLECRALVTKDPVKRLQNELRIALLYARAGDEKEAEKCWQEAGKANNWIKDKNSYREFKHLGEQMRRLKLDSQAKKIEDKLSLVDQIYKE